ncbi:MAG: Crp/Fnr family transcriptional regulator, partial [Bacteroidia bacterium]|nr:Crp/Fnr family transcriptional regulator [Bacteroidia bacterium]
GEVAMAAHPNLTTDEAQAMAVYIKSLTGAIYKAPSLPLEGSIVPKASSQNNVMVLTASYTDKGGKMVEPLTGIHTLKITGSTRSFAGVDNLEGFTPVNDDEMDLLILPQDGGWFALENIDMTGIGTINLVTGWQQLPTSQIEIQVRQESPEGSVIGTGKMLKPKEGQLSELIRIRLDKPVDGVMDKLYFTYLPVEEEKLSTDVALVNVTFGR